MIDNAEALDDSLVSKENEPGLSGNDQIVESTAETITGQSSESPEESISEAPPTAEPVEMPEPEPTKKDWYILKVQVNREETIKENLRRRIQLAGLEQYFDDLLVPTEKVTVVKNGQKRVTKRKLYPGYLMVRMEINDDTWFLVRETSGIGDFTGAGGKPVPMQAHEVQRILQSEKSETEEAPKLKIPYAIGDRVKIIDGTFKDVEGEVHLIDDVTGRITVNITIFARSTPVELEYWQVEKTED